MRLKLDENLGKVCAETLSAAGHDVATVFGQGMGSAPDSKVIEVCRSEQRALVTLDLDFANTLRYPPHDYPGIAVIRLPARAHPALLREAILTLSAAMGSRTLKGKLWVVQPALVREHQPEDESARRE